jgi:RNA polymerase sigma-70 factor (ECF subfamily)
MQIAYTLHNGAAAQIGIVVPGTTDEILIEAISKGDSNAMRMLFTRHNVRIFRFVLRLIGDNSVAEDVVSEVFLDVWRQAASFKARAQVLTRLLAIARNKAHSVLRRSSDLQHLEEEAVQLKEILTGDLRIVMQKKEKAAILVKSLKQLSASHREIIDLVYYHQRTIDEISKIIHVPTNTVRARIFHARKRIATMLTANGSI